MISSVFLRLRLPSLSDKLRKCSPKAQRDYVKRSILPQTGLFSNVHSLMTGLILSCTQIRKASAR